MPLIVDANVAHRVLGRFNDTDFGPVSQRVFGGRAILVYGGKLLEEYSRHNAVASVVRELDRIGRARQIPKQEIATKMKRLSRQDCRSNDLHIVALALVSGARLLCSHDRALHADFTNPNLLDPKGAVYQNRQHVHLLVRYCKQDGLAGGRKKASNPQS